MKRKEYGASANLTRLLVATTACLLVQAVFVGVANASWGYATGQLLYFENEGNFCPSARSCIGAKYLQSDFNQNLPVANVKVYVRRASDNAILGQGTSDGNGSFSVYWYDLSASGNVDGLLSWHGEHKDGRFYVRLSDGSLPWFWTWTQPLIYGGYSNFGTPTWGSSASPEPYSNIYGGAQRMWNNSLGQSTRMNNYFGGVNILPFNSGTCSTSCASGSDNTIWLDNNAAYSPQARIMHEMGHIASYKASYDQGFIQPGTCALYSYPYTTCVSNSWNLTSPEWEAPSFEEAVATHLGDVGLYADNAVEPHTCLSSFSCGTGSFNIEQSPGTSCATDQNRVPLNHVRYHWDNYDSLVDYPGETLNRGVWEVLDTIHAFGNGWDNRQKNETWGCTPYPTHVCGGFVDDYNGRSPIDFRENWKTWGTDSSTQLANNCGSAGD